MRAAPLGLRDGDRERLEGWVRSSTIQAGLSRRARIVLLAADGLSNVEIAERVGVSLPTVTSWRTRYREGGISGLEDEARPVTDVVGLYLAPPENAVVLCVD